MNSVGNIFWLLLGGIIIGIPFGIRHFKMAIASIFPFGKEIRKTKD